MNKHFPVSNNTAVPMYVGTAMIPPGETRHFALELLPPELRPVEPAPAAAVPVDPLAELSAQSVKAIVEQLPALSDLDLDRLGEMEQQKGGEARKKLLSAIAEAQLQRAEASQDAAG